MSFNEGERVLRWKIWRYDGSLLEQFSFAAGEELWDVVWCPQPLATGKPLLPCDPKGASAACAMAQLPGRLYLILIFPLDLNTQLFTWFSLVIYLTPVTVVKTITCTKKQYFEISQAPVPAPVSVPGLVFQGIKHTCAWGVWGVYSPPQNPKYPSQIGA